MGRPNETPTRTGGALLSIESLEPAQLAFLRRIRSSLEARGVRESGTLKLSTLPRDEAIALADLLGTKKIPSAPHLLQLARLDSALKSSSIGLGLLQTLEALDGPMQDQRVERAKHREASRSFWETLLLRDEVTARPELREWVERIQRGTLRRVAQDEDAGVLVDTTLNIVSRLPSDGIRLQVLASDATGDPHALDLGMPLATLVQSALASLARRPTPTSAGERRALWEWAGVSVDTLSSDVLVLGLTPRGGGLVSEALRSHAAAMEPIRLTLRQLKREPLELPGISSVYVCENPAVLEQAADELTELTHPLICTEGMLSGAAESLLRALSSAGIQLHFHGDFDWGGVRIGNVLVERFGACPWQYAREDYESAVAAVSPKADLIGSPIQARWDAELSAAMDQLRIAVYEEQLIARLIADLKQRGGRPE